jgi:sugar (pentulose or hexulose) kinase
MAEDQSAIAAQIERGDTSLGIEFGSTRIKAVLIDQSYHVIAQGDHGWENHLDNGIWTYPLSEVWSGLQDAYRNLAQDVCEHYHVTLTHIGVMGFSAMMHGYLPFDKEGNLLVPFRTWRNTMTEEASRKLTALFNYNIPQRYSIAHFYQAILKQEEHVPQVAFLTTLAGYVHWKLTGRQVLGIGDASGMFPIDPATRTYNADDIAKFNALPEVSKLGIHIEKLLPTPLVAGQDAGTLSAEGAHLLDPSGTLQPGAKLAPPEGDAGTGMVATNAVRPRTGNVSAGTSIFGMVVLEHPLQKAHPEVDPVATPAGDLAGMSHANNFTTDLNAWVNLFGQFAKASGSKLSTNDLFRILFQSAISPEADADCGGLLNYCLYSGEPLVGVEQGRPLFVHSPKAHMSLANFMRAQLFSAFAPVTVGMRVMTQSEGVRIDRLVGHGGVFATPVVAQKLLAAAVDAPITVMSTASEGGPWGMAVLADYLRHTSMPLADFLDERVFKDAQSSTIQPDPKDVAGFEKFFARFSAGMAVEKAAIAALPQDEE